MSTVPGDNLLRKQVPGSQASQHLQPGAAPTGDKTGSRENSYRLKLWGRGGTLQNRMRILPHRVGSQLMDCVALRRKSPWGNDFHNASRHLAAEGSRAQLLLQWEVLGRKLEKSRFYCARIFKDVVLRIQSSIPQKSFIGHTINQAGSTYCTLTCYVLCFSLLEIKVNKENTPMNLGEDFFSCIPAKAVNLLRSFPFSLCFLGSSEPSFSTHFSGCSGSHGMDSDGPWLCFPEVFLFLSVWTTLHPCFLFLFFQIGVFS